MNTTQYRLQIVYEPLEMQKHFDLIKVLPSHDYSREEYLEMLEEMVTQGYSQALAFDGEKCVAIAGYWINTKLFTGRYAELDNVIVSAEYRNKGIGEKLCVFVEEDAKKKGCGFMVLDCFLENTAAQRFYNRLGYAARGYHMIKKIS